MRTFAILLLILWFSRIPALDALPLHNDEGLHLTRAVEVWNLHPFWEIRDGKIINQWAIALFYPQNAPVFAGRIATVFVSLIGFAAGYALIRRIFGKKAALMAGVLWIASPYLFFFERLALSDAEAGALVVLALWASWTLAERGTIRRAIFTGIALALATLFKFTAAPFALSVALIVLLRA
ncbi:MAG: glycosyltransferase family 39 protein, partial [Chloroflexota bacterium]